MLSIMLILTLILCTGIPAFGNTVDENQVPVRMAFENESIPVGWIHDTKTVVIGSDNQLTMSIGSKTIQYDGLTYEMDYAPKLIAGKTYVDKRFFEEFLLAKVEGTTVEFPSFIATLLTNDYPSKIDIYQQPVEGEEAFLKALNAQTGWDFALELGKIGSTDMGFRTAGTPEGKEAADLVFEKYQELGLDPKYNTFKLYGWRFLDASLSVEGVVGDLPVVSAVGSKATPDDGITAEMVFVGTASKKDLEGVDLTGKIALVAADLDYHPWYSQVAHSVYLKGAIGLVYYCENYYSQYEGYEAFNVQDWSGIELDLPVLNIPKKYGLLLKDQLVTEGSLATTLVSKTTIDENADGYNVIGVIEGQKYPDEFVIVNAHTDAYFTGFQDDSIAIGGMISFAEAIQNSDYSPDRTIVFLSMDAEEFGAIDMGTDWLIGSWNLVNSDDFIYTGKTVGSLTLELMAYEGAKEFEMRASDTLHEFILNTAKGFDYEAFEGLGIVKNEISNMSDEFSIALQGIPTFRTNTHSFVVENIYHSQFDTPETTSFEKYQECLESYGSLLLRMDKLAVHPYDLTNTIDQYNSAVDYDKLVALGLGTSLKTEAEKYSDIAQELYFTNALILKMYDQAVQSNLDTIAVDEKIEAYNQKMRDTVKTIIVGTTHLAGESVAFELPFYVKLYNTLSTGIAALEEGDGAAAAKIFNALPASYYADYNEYEVWYHTNIDNINPKNPDRYIYWGEDIKVQYIDHYTMTRNLDEKVAQGDTNYSAEIKIAKSFLPQVESNLRNAYRDDLAMFKAANAGAPTEEALAIIDLLN